MSNAYIERASKLVWTTTTLVATLLLLTPVSLVSANATAKDVHELTDICMFSQRLLKDYALIGMGVTYHDPKEDLLKNTKTVDQYFEDLKSHHLKKGLDDEIKELEKRWKIIEAKLLHTPDKKNMVELHDMIDEFTKLCEQAAFDVAEDTHIEGERYVVLISELGMESQRLAALYMMKAWGVAKGDYYDVVEKILHEYEAIYKELITADDKLVSTQIKKKLAETEKHFLVFKFMAASKSGRFVPTRAEKSASKIFHEIQDILKLEGELVE